mgnify:CR=1 FL=1
MREILFKAKRNYDGKWIEGYYLRDQYHISGNDIIFYRKDSDRFTVYTDTIDLETLCQFTGLCDKNGNKIWENDIVLVIYENRYYEKKELSTGKIVFTRGAWYIGGKVRNELYTIDKDAIFQVEIVGNIFDNPELLQEESDE